MADDLTRWLKTGAAQRHTLMGLEAGPRGRVAYTVPDDGQWPYETVEDTYPGARVTAVHPTPAAAYAALAAGQVARNGDRERLLVWRRRALAAENQLRRRSLDEERRERAEQREEEAHGE